MSELKNDKLKDVPEISSKEFADLLKSKGFTKKEYIFSNNNIKSDEKTDDDIPTSNNFDNPINQIVGKIMDWSDEHPGMMLVVLGCLGCAITWKITTACLASGIAKGNIKTLKWFEKYGTLTFKKIS